MELHWRVIHYSKPNSCFYNSHPQIQNLGFFPVKDLQLNIEIPEMTTNGNQLLKISDFHIDQVKGCALIPMPISSP